MYETAKAIVVEKPMCAAVQEIRMPEVTDESVVVKTAYSGISMGTELKVWSGVTGALGGELWYPLVGGYEQVGEVVYVGPKAKKTYDGQALEVGDRVMNNEIRYFPDYCHAWGGQTGISINNPTTCPAKPDWPAKIPDNVSYQEAVCAYLACVSKKGFDRVQPQAGKTVLVTGAGMVGISWMQLAKLAGCRVIAMENNPKRAKLAEQFVDEMIDTSCNDPETALADLTDGNMADIIVECSGDPEMPPKLYKYLRDGGWDRGEEFGHIHLQGDYPAPIVLTPYQNWFTKNCNISLTCAVSPGGKEEIMQLVSEGKFKIKPLLESEMTEEVSVDDAPTAFQRAWDSHKDIFKVIFKW